jgi:hypothetical protein
MAIVTTPDLIACRGKWAAVLWPGVEKRGEVRALLRGKIVAQPLQLGLMRRHRQVSAEQLEP